MSLPQLGARGALERELGERHACLLADLERGEAEIHIESQPFGTHLVEDGLAAMVIGDLAQPPHQLFRPLLRAHRVAERDPAATGDLVHHEGIAGLAEQQPLVAAQGGVGERRVRALDERARAGQLLGPGDRGLGPRRPQHVEENVGAAEHDDRERRAQHARRVAVQREGPPQLIGVADLPMRDDADPHGHRDHPKDARYPHGREALGEDRGGAVEGAPPEHQHAEDQREDDRLLEIEALQERREHARDQQPHRDVVGGLHAAEQRAREHQQSQSRQAPAEVRHLEHRERQELIEEREPLLDPGRRARDEQQRAGQEGERAGDLRHDRRDVDARQLVRAGERGALPRELLGAEQQRGEEQRHEIVDAAVREQRADECVRRNAGQRQQHHRLEHADAAGNVADDAGDHCRRIDAEEADEADVRSRRQQRPEHRARERQVRDPEQDLRQADRRSRSAQRPAADLELAACERGPERVGTDRAEQRRPDEQRPAVMQAQHARGVRQGEQQRQARHGRESDTEGQTAEAGEGRHVDGAEARGGIQPEADRRSGEGGEAERMPERVGDEGREHDARVADLSPQVAQRQHLVGGEQPITRRREGERGQHLAARDGVQVLEDAADVQPRELAVQQQHHARKHQERRERPEPAAQRPLVASLRRRRGQFRQGSQLSLQRVSGL